MDSDVPWAKEEFARNRISQGGGGLHLLPLDLLGISGRGRDGGYPQPPGCRQRRRHHLVRLDSRIPYAYEFVKSVELYAAFEGAKQLRFGKAATTSSMNRRKLIDVRRCLT